MKKLIVNIAIAVGSVYAVHAQTNSDKSSMAVSTPSVQGLYITPKLATKLINLELIKLNKYKVYDEFDMAEVIKSHPEFQTDCFGLNCITALGKALKVDYVAGGSIDKLGAKIVISLKIVDVNSASIHKTIFKEFDNQEAELQRMIEITLREMEGLENQKETVDRLTFKNEVITSNNVGRINNSGPRIGFAVLNGTAAEFAKRNTEQGGLDIAPMMSMIGYQFEKQYVGTEAFSALFETILNVSGLEQGRFLPSVAFMNGFRFGNNGWEFAFGPSFGFQKTSTGFFDANNLYGKGENAYWTESEFSEYDRQEYLDANPYPLSTSYDSNDPYYVYENSYKATKPGYSLSKNLDNRGQLGISTRFVIGVGRTFHTGGLNIPVNVFYSSVKKGGMVGLSVGFNVLKKKESINSRI